MSETQRDIRYELLRMLAMFAIVLYHFMGVNGDHVERAYIRYAILILGSGGKIAVNIFLIISCWFMVDKSFKAERVVRTWYMVISYAVPISAAMLLLRPSLGNAACLLKSCFPVFTRPLWFASAYILLILLEPFLNRMLQGIGKRQHAALTITLLIPCCLAATIMFHDDFLNNLMWFIFVYIFVSFVKRYWGNQMPKKSGLYFSAALVLYMVLCTTEFALGSSGMNLFGGKLAPLSTFAHHWLTDIKALPNFLCAMLVFLGFSGLKHCNMGGGKCYLFLGFVGVCHSPDPVVL